MGTNIFTFSMMVTPNACNKIQWKAAQEAASADSSRVYGGIHVQMKAWYMNMNSQWSIVQHAMRFRESVSRTERVRQRDSSVSA